MFDVALGLLEARLLELQGVVADEQRWGADQLAFAVVLDLEQQLTVLAKQRRKAGSERDRAVATEPGLVGFAILEDLRMQADPGVDEKRPLVHDADLHVRDASVDECPRGIARLTGDAVGARRVVE